MDSVLPGDRARPRGSGRRRHWAAADVCAAAFLSFSAFRVSTVLTVWIFPLTFRSLTTHCNLTMTGCYITGCSRPFPTGVTQARPRRWFSALLATRLLRPSGADLAALVVPPHWSTRAVASRL